MFMKDTAFLQQLQQELPRRSLTPKATQRFEDTYKLLGVAERGSRSQAPPQGAVDHRTAACLCCGMLFGVNAAFRPSRRACLGWDSFSRR